MKNTDVIQGKFDVLIKHKNTEEASRLFDCDKVEYIQDRKRGLFDHHLMFYRKGKLVFKVWLKNSSKDKEYKNIENALKDVGISLFMFERD